MSRFTISRLLAPELARPLSRTVCPTTTVPQWTRLLSQSHAAKNIWTPPQPPTPQQRPSSGSISMDRLAKSVMRGAALPTESLSASLPEQLEVEEEEQGEEPYHFHIYSHKHNTHITLTKPNRDALISLSCGNIGFRKSGRKHYDSAYQLGAYVINKMHQKGLVKKIHKLEVVLRGFGPGREAVVKVLMGNEGQLLRPKITRVSDSTRLKFGGTRSKRKRRLG
ncbi:translational machinery component [Parathielavia appendiculata]|uniref:Small ribosomal subunit protein uS11m n=1 Tax=Parathielavia appendiculata TaxID=2587402 RepID=A0AAN6UAE9_9PEZI|nr:translational machinery component [Parathielavia appendiculata]